MVQYYRDYIWKNGLPYGVKPCDTISYEKDLSYKIVSDPYHKRVSIEQYRDGSFSRIIYDSWLFDFRHLKLGEQLAWQKTTISEVDHTIICHIRNQDDRLLLVEEYLFEKELCRQCRAFSPLGILLSVQKIFYTELNDAFNGVVLFDSNAHAVMSKNYEFDEESRMFSTLLKENWEVNLVS